VPKLGQVPADFFDAAGKLTSGELAALLNQLYQEVRHASSGGGGVTWTAQTNGAVEYAGGFYQFNSGSNSFSPSITFGAVNVAKAAHFAVVTRALTVDEVRITVTGSSINDNGERVGADSQVIVIPEGTPANSYFETPKKWNGQVTVETTAGTPIQCNYGWTKYHDVNNQDFVVSGLECLWESDSSDSGSDIELIHHKATGWTFNGGGEPSPPIASARSIDHGPDIVHEVGPGAWKRSNLNIEVNGEDSEGILFRVTSGSTGIGSLSFRLLTLQVSLTVAPLFGE
jgi:hypothetical protein